MKSIVHSTLTLSHQVATVVFVDAGVDNYQQLVDGVIPTAEVFVLDRAVDGIEQISQVLQQRQDVGAVHIVSHGAPGCLYLGDSQLSLDTFNRYATQLQQWDVANLLLYGCHVAVGDAGAEFVEKLHQLTKAGVAASTTPIGSAMRGGTWELNYCINSHSVNCVLSKDVKKDYAGILSPTIEPGHYLVNGLGGKQGFGETVLPGVDDTYWQVDISSIFENGLNYFGTTYDAATDVYIGSNGYITFGEGLVSYNPTGIAGSTIPIIAPHYSDVDTGNSVSGLHNPTGNSTGTNQIYYDIDSVNDVFTITFDDVQPFSGTQNNNAYQVRLWDLGSGDFGIEFRYEDLVWGRSGNTDYSTAGWSAGDQTNYGEIPGSGTSELENVESQSNIGQPGVFYFSINDINEISGTPNRDLLKGTASADQIDGLEDNDRLYGYDGNDILDGNDDNDIVYGGAGDDLINGGAGRDRLYGDNGNDILVGDMGHDLLKGGTGDDLINGGAGRDRLYGGAGDDLINGGAGRDRLYGGAGDDLINGGAGRDRLYGNAGRDTFVLASGMGTDTIYDFEDGVDLLQLDSGLSFGQLEITQRGSRTQINIADTGETLVTLLRTDSTLITEADFTIA